MDKDKVVNDLAKKLFFEARDIERMAQRMIKKLTALDKVLKGVYQPKPKEVKKVEASVVTPVVKN